MRSYFTSLTPRITTGSTVCMVCSRLRVGCFSSYSIIFLSCALDLFEARAILLGRLGRHDQALELYVYRLHDYLKAEE